MNSRYLKIVFSFLYRVLFLMKTQLRRHLQLRFTKKTRHFSGRGDELRKDDFKC